MRFIIGVLWLVFFIWALVDILAAKKDAGWKILWLIVCLIFPIVGVLVYYFAGRPQTPPSS